VRGENSSKIGKRKRGGQVQGRGKVRDSGPAYPGQPYRQEKLSPLSIRITVKKGQGFMKKTKQHQEKRKKKKNVFCSFWVL